MTRSDAEAMARLARAAEREHHDANVPSEAFNKQWDARAALLLDGRDTSRAEHLTDEWKHLVGGEDVAAEPQLDAAKLDLLTREDDRSELSRAQDVVEGAAALFRYGDMRRDSLRRYCWAPTGSWNVRNTLLHRFDGGTASISAWERSSCTQMTSTRSTERRSAPWPNLSALPIGSLVTYWRSVRERMLARRDSFEILNDLTELDQSNVRNALAWLRGIAFQRSSGFDGALSVDEEGWPT